MTDVPAPGALAKLCFDSVAPIDTSSIPFEFVSENLRMVQTHVRSEGIRGTRSRKSHRVRIAREQITGSVVMNPSVTEIDWLLPYMLGGSTSLGVTDVADTLGEFVGAIDRVTKVFTYTGLRVARWSISGSSGQALVLTLDLEGETETVGNAGTFPALTLDTDNFFVFSDITLTLASSARKVQSFTLTMDNALDAERFNNSITRAEIAAMDRSVTLECSVPYTSDNSDLYDQAVAGAAGSLAISDGSTTYTIAFGNVKAPAESPTVPGRSEILLPLRLDCYSTDAASECKFTKT